MLLQSTRCNSCELELTGAEWLCDQTLLELKEGENFFIVSNRKDLLHYSATSPVGGPRSIGATAAVFGNPFLDAITRLVDGFVVVRRVCWHCQRVLHQTYQGSLQAKQVRRKWPRSKTVGRRRCAVGLRCLVCKYHRRTRRHPAGQPVQEKSTAVLTTRRPALGTQPAGGRSSARNCTKQTQRRVFCFSAVQCASFLLRLI